MACMWPALTSSDGLLAQVLALVPGYLGLLQILPGEHDGALQLLLLVVHLAFTHTFDTKAIYLSSRCMYVCVHMGPTSARKAGSSFPSLKFMTWATAFTLQNRTGQDRLG